MQSKLIRVLCVVLVCVFTMTLALGGAAYLTARAENDATAAATASGKCGEDLFWSYDPASGILTILGTGAMWDYDRPEDAPWASIASGIKTIAFSTGVTVIGKNAFAGCPVESIQFPQTLTEIHENAFSGCEKLAAVDLSTTQVTAIEAGTFSGSAVEQVQFPQTLTQIKENAFSGCESLTAVDLSATQVTTIEAGAFTGCSSLTTEAVVLPETATSVSEAAFDEAVVLNETEEPAPAQTYAETPDAESTNPRIPTEPVKETKTYTTRDHANVTEYWENGILVKTVKEYPNKFQGGTYDHVLFTKDRRTGISLITSNQTIVYSDYVNGKPQLEEYTTDGEPGSTTRYTYDDSGRVIKAVTNGRDGYSETIEYEYTSTTEGILKGERFFGVTGSLTTLTGSVTLYDDGTIQSSDILQTNALYESYAKYENEYAADGVISARRTSSSWYQYEYYYQDGLQTGYEEYESINGAWVRTATVETTFDEDGIPKTSTKDSYSVNPGPDGNNEVVHYSTSTAKHDSAGQIIEEVRKFDDGRTGCSKYENGWLAWQEYDEWGTHVTGVGSWDENGVYTYVETDDEENIKTVRTVNQAERTESEQHFNEGDLWYQFCSQYDENGNTTESVYTQYNDGKVWSTSRDVYDSTGISISSTYTYYDENEIVTSISTTTYDRKTGNSVTVETDGYENLIRTTKVTRDLTTGTSVTVITGAGGEPISTTTVTNDQEFGIRAEKTVYADGRVEYTTSDSNWNTLEAKTIAVDENGNVSSITHTVYDPDTRERATTTTTVTTGEDGNLYITVTDAAGTSEPEIITKEKLAELAAIPMPGEDTAEAASNGILLAAALEEGVEETEEVTEGETSVEEDSTDETPADETPADETPAEEVPAEEVPAEEVPAEEVPAEEVPAEEVPAEEVPAEEVPAEEVSAEEVPAEEVPAEEVPAEEVPVVEIPAEETPVEEAPIVEEVPAGETRESADQAA